MLGGRLGSAGFLERGCHAEPLRGLIQIGVVVLPEVASGDVEARKVVSLVEEAEDARANPPADAEHHRLAEILAGVGRPHARIRQQDTQGGRLRVDARKVQPAR